VDGIVQETLRVWGTGGWCMGPLAAVGLVMYGTGVQLWMVFRCREFEQVPAADWGGWVQAPATGRGEVGEIIRYTQDGVTSLGEIESRFAEVHTAKIPSINRRLAFMHVLMVAAPLLGLLGTVLGMIKTFAAIALGTGNMVEMISLGIAEALITTETGLLIALPGYFLSYSVRSKRAQYEAFLAQLESATLQKFQKQLNPVTA
jgi:biopolymer transport protein ExbB